MINLTFLPAIQINNTERIEKHIEKRHPDQWYPDVFFLVCRTKIIYVFLLPVSKKNHLRTKKTAFLV